MARATTLTVSGLLLVALIAWTIYSLRFRSGEVVDEDHETSVVGRRLLGKDHTFRDGKAIPLYANKVGPFQNPR